MSERHRASGASARAARTILLTTAGLAALTATPALAQAAPEVATAVIDEVIVTARRREESLIETPIAVSIASGETLRERDVVAAPDLIKLTPGLTAQLGANQSRRTSRFAIRGQGGGTGVVSYFAEVPEISSAFFDLQNVQVLKGPVGTLFGRVTTGGAILFTPNMPGEAFEGYVDLKMGEYGRRDVEFAVGGPLIDGVLGVRVAGQVLKSEGFTRNLYDGGFQDGRDGQSFRAIVKLTPTESLTNTTIGVLDYIQDPTRSGHITIARSMTAGNAALISGNNQRIAPSLAQLNGIACPGGVCPTWLSLAQKAVSDQAARSVYVGDENNVNYPFPDSRQWGVINTTTYEFNENLTLKNILSYQETDARGPGSQNIDGWGLPMLEQVTVPRPGARGLTEEIQLQGDLLDDRLEFTAGFYYEKAWTPHYQGGHTILYGGYLGEATSAAVCAAAGARADPGSAGRFNCYIGARSTMGKTRNRDEALFGQATFHVTDKFSITGGYRYTWSERASTIANFTSVSPQLLNDSVPSRLIAINGVAPFRVPGTFKHLPGEVFTEVKSEKGTYTLAAQYEFSPDFMVYATTREGYNPGGRNSRAPAGQEVYGPEIVTDYEIGVKRAWRVGEFSGLVAFDLYRDDYEDAQRNTTLPVNGVPTVYVGNVANIRIQGFDLDTTLRYGAFDLKAFVTLTDAKYLDYPNTGQFPELPPPADLTQIKPANVSEWVWGLQPSVDFSQLIDGAPEIVLSGNIYHRGEFSSSEPNIGPDEAKIIPANTQLDLRLDWRNIGSKPLSAALAVTNVTDYNGKIGGNELRTTNGTNIDVFAPPRTWYVELNYQF